MAIEKYFLSWDNHDLDDFTFSSDKDKKNISQASFISTTALNWIFYDTLDNRKNWL